MKRIFIVLFLSLCLCASLTASPPRYSVTDVGPADSRQSVFINNHGQIAWSYWPGRTAAEENPGKRSFFWLHGRRTSLSLPRGYDSTIVYGINNHEQITGSLDATYDGPLNIVSHAFLWQHGVTQDLGAPDGDQVSEARAINDSGEIVGRAYASGKPVEEDASLIEHHAFLYRNGQFTDLGVGEADAINDNGQIVGDTPSLIYFDAALWDKGRLVKLGIHGVAVAINNSGLIVIQSSTAHSVLWHQGRFVDLPPLSGDNQAQAVGINAQGWVVGTASDERDSRAALWRSGKVFDLNKCIPQCSGWVLSTATGINDKGQITGYGLSHSKPCAFLLTPH